MDIGFLQRNVKEGGYLLFHDIKRVVQTLKKVGNEYKWFYMMNDYEGGERYVSKDHYSLTFVIEE